VCSADLLQNPRRIGGPGHVVAIDETVVARAKPGNAHARPVTQQWVFGGTDLTTKEYFMEMVPARDAATLIPVIQRNIVAGSTIWSDEWAAYRTLNQHGYLHNTVNHSRYYVDPATGVHTNNIEARWSACKAAFKRRFGVARHLLPQYLDEYMWRSRHSHPNTFTALINAISVQYPL
jgi:transposase-like protein